MAEKDGDPSVEAVLLMGPLYHLTEPAERTAALGEARRVLQRGGVIFAVGICRFASLLAGLAGSRLPTAAGPTRSFQNAC
jgi:hypothetical protein